MEEILNCITRIRTEIKAIIPDNFFIDDSKVLLHYNHYYELGRILHKLEHIAEDL